MVCIFYVLSSLFCIAMELQLRPILSTFRESFLNSIKSLLVTLNQPLLIDVKKKNTAQIALSILLNEKKMIPDMERTFIQVENCNVTSTFAKFHINSQFIWKCVGILTFHHFSIVFISNTSKFPQLRVCHCSYFIHHTAFVY